MTSVPILVARSAREQNAGTMTRCRICEGPPDAWFELSELMFRTGERFPYFQCRACGCLQIETIPSDLGRLYEPPYYSVSGAPPAPRRQSLRRRLVRRWAIDRRGGPIAALLYAHHPEPALKLLGDLGVRREDRVLDVGSGRGDRVVHLHSAGFASAMGVDPHLPADVTVAGRLVARRASLDELEGTFRLIMFNHVLEHMPDPRAALASARRLLSPSGQIVVRVPTVSSEAWETYRQHWVQLDPPRHLYLHSRASLGVLATRSGLRLESVHDDSVAFQFWGSERVRRGLPLAAPDGTFRPDDVDRATLRRLERRARALNRAGRGDQVVAIFTQRAILDERPQAVGPRDRW